jgi:hypothetical protein
MMRRNVLPQQFGRGEVDFASIAQVALAHADVLLRRWLPAGRRCGNEWVALNPTRNDMHAGSFRINVLTGRWADFAVGASGGDLISLAAYLFSMGQGEAARRITSMLGVDHES